MNLAHNAVKHTAEGDTIALGSALDDGDARIWVTDTGPGIAPEDQERIFERFAPGRRRAPTAPARPGDRQRSPPPTAGASSSRAEPGQGATFTIVLPGAGAAMSRILIAEDERNLVSFLEKALRAAGYATTTVNDGPSAIALARDEDFELLILDLGLPSLDGTEVLKTLRAQRRAAAGDHPDRPRRRARQGRRPAARSRRLPDQAVRVRRAAGADPGPPEKRRDERAGDARPSAASRSTCAPGARRSRGARSSSRRASSRCWSCSCATPTRSSAASSCSPASGATTSTPAPMSSRSTSAICAASSGRTTSRPCAAWATGSSRC